MLNWLLNEADHYGYIVVFLGVGIESMGVPVPGETSLLVGAVLAGAGHLNLALVVLAGWLGAVIGDNTGYWIGHRWGRRLVKVPLIGRVYRPEHLAAAERFFDRRGVWAVFLGRFIALLRILAGPLAGMHRMPWPRFLLSNAGGGAVWVVAVCAIGLLIGKNLEAADRFLNTTGYAALIITTLISVGVAARFLWHRRRGRA